MTEVERLKVELRNAKELMRALRAENDRLRSEARGLLRQIGVEDDGPGMVGQEGE